jgi:hypothetical protein
MNPTVQTPVYLVANGFRLPNVPKGKKVIVHVSIGCLIGAYRFGKIAEYANNRGDQGVSQEAVKEMLEDICLLAIGSVHITEPDEEGVHVLGDFHHRIVMLAQAEERGLLSTDDLDVLVPVVVMNRDDHYRVYVKLNKTRSHKSNQKITNPDTMFGWFVHYIQNELAKSKTPLELSDAQCIKLCKIVMANIHTGGQETSIQDTIRAEKGTGGKKGVRSYDAVPFDSEEQEHVELRSQLLSLVPCILEGAERLCEFGSRFSASPKCSINNPKFDTGFFYAIMHDAVSGYDYFAMTHEQMDAAASNVFRNASATSAFTESLAYLAKETLSKVKVAKIFEHLSAWDGITTEAMDAWLKTPATVKVAAPKKVAKPRTKKQK